MKKVKYVWGFQMVGPDCGRDECGVFYCRCGKCLPLRVDVGQGGEYCGDDCGEGRYEGEKHVNKKPPFLRFGF